MVSRRQFLKAGFGLTVAASGFEMIGGCATTEAPKVATLVYPQLPYHKVQPPHEGCLVGFFKEPEASLRMKDSNFVPQHSALIEAARRAKTFDEFAEILKTWRYFEWMNRYRVEREIDYVEKSLGAKPFVFAFVWPKLFSGFPLTQAISTTKRGIRPFVYAGLGIISLPVPVPGFGPKEIAEGQHDRHIKEFAQGATKFGMEHGGFFITTMEEMNGDWFSWGKNSNFIQSWRHIWEIFEDEGANRYATWVWVIYCLEGLPANAADPPEAYYPGDKYVDWIGVNAFSIANNQFADFSLHTLIGRTYKRFLKDHPQKPLMIPSFGRTNNSYQSRWLLDTYRSIKNSFPAIKAAFYFDNTWRLTGDHTLNPKSYEKLKEIFQDSYWVMGK